MKYVKITLAFTISFLLVVSCGSNKKQEENVADTFGIEDYIKAAEAVEPNLNKVDQMLIC